MTRIGDASSRMQCLHPGWQDGALKMLGLGGTCTEES